VLGLLICPFTGATRFVTDLSHGIAGSTEDFYNLGKPKADTLDMRKVRIRWPRRIDSRG
jgi:hypothetical protein